MKKLISIICLFALSIQALPLRDIGRILFNQQINEELPHSCTTAKDSDIKFEETGFYRVFLLDDNDKTVASALIEIISK